MITTRRRRTAFLLVLLMGGGAVGCAASRPGGGSDSVTLQPISYRVPERGNLIILDVPWSASGACIDQFKPSIEETATTIRVGPVTRSSGDEDCADVGTDGKTLSVTAPLNEPIAGRAVLSQDGEPLPVRALAS